MRVGRTVYPDFFHPNASRYWKDMLDILYKKVQFSGLWLDSNEFTNFCEGRCEPPNTPRRVRLRQRPALHTRVWQCLRRHACAKLNALQRSPLSGCAYLQWLSPSLRDLSVPQRKGNKAIHTHKEFDSRLESVCGTLDR